MHQLRSVRILFWMGLLIAFAFAGGATWSLLGTFRVHTAAEVARSVWHWDKALFKIWAFAVPMGTLMAVIGALLYVKAGRSLAWILGIGFWLIVFPMVAIFTRKYYPLLFGLGGILILLTFFALVWIWMKQYAGQEHQRKVAGSYKLIGYLFWINATWFLCGETAKMHLKVYEGSVQPSPIEIMVFLVLGWFFVTLGEYRSVRAEQGP